MTINHETTRLQTPDSKLHAMGTIENAHSDLNQKKNSAQAYLPLHVMTRTPTYADFPSPSQKKVARYLERKKSIRNRHNLLPLYKSPPHGPWHTSCIHTPYISCVSSRCVSSRFASIHGRPSIRCWRSCR